MAREVSAWAGTCGAAADPQPAHQLGTLTSGIVHTKSLQSSDCNNFALACRSWPLANAGGWIWKAGRIPPTGRASCLMYGSELLQDVVVAANHALLQLCDSARISCNPLCRHSLVPESPVVRIVRVFLPKWGPTDRCILRCPQEQVHQDGAHLSKNPLRIRLENQ